MVADLVQLSMYVFRLVHSVRSAVGDALDSGFIAYVAVINVVLIRQDFVYCLT